MTSSECFNMTVGGRVITVTAGRSKSRAAWEPQKDNISDQAMENAKNFLYAYNQIRNFPLLISCNNN